MIITNISLSNYRNHSNLKIDTNGKYVIIYGENGVGKTNVLEAVSLLSPGRGLRGSKFDEIIPSYSSVNEWAVISNVGSEDDLNTIATGYTNLAKNSKRIIRVNNTNLSKQAEVLDYLRVIWLTPQMDGIFISSPSTRRKFLDRLTYNFFPDHAKYVANYEHYARSRIKLISEGRYDDLWLSRIEESIADFSIKIAKGRRHCLEMLNSYIEKQSSNFLKPYLSVKCQLEQKLSNNSKGQLLEEIKSILKSNRLKDAKAKRASFGTHITDLEVLNPLKNASAAISSTGEQKGMLISIILGQIKAINENYNVQPIVLLDEVFTHLDNERREQLADELRNLNAQIWVTSTEFDINKYFDDPIEIMLENKINKKLNKSA